MHLLNTMFDKVVCINLLERKDKREKMQKKFDDLGIEIEWYHPVQYGFIPNIVNPIIDAKVGHFNKSQPFEFGCALSHYTVIKKALLEGYERLFVFEDDAVFHKDFNNKLKTYMDDLPENWDLILLYSFMYNILPQNIRVSKRWIKSYKAWSLMAYGMKRKFMEEYIKRQDKFFTISDGVSYNMQETSDFNIYSAIPTLCIPDISMGSNIRGESLNYKNTPTCINLGYDENNYDK